MVFLILLAIFIGVPVVEIATFIKVGGEIGIFSTIAFTFFTAFLGVVLVRWQGFQALEEMRQAMDAGKPPVMEIVGGALILLAGVLLLVPGFVTDAIGFILLVPPLRRAIAAAIIGWLERNAVVSARTGPGGVTVIEAEVVEIDGEPVPLERDKRDKGGDESPWRKDGS